MSIETESSKFYCKTCNKHYKQDETKKVYNYDMTQKRHLCPHCSNRLYRICQTCYQGKMFKPEHPTTGDFTAEGYLESFCTICGAGFIQTIIKFDINKFYISKRNIKRLLDKVFTRQGIPYSDKNQVMEQITVVCKTRDQIIGFFKESFDEDEVFINNELVGKYVNF